MTGGLIRQNRALPAALPFPHSTSSLSRQARDGSAPSTPRKNASTTGRIPAAPGRIGRQQLEQLAARLGDRDCAVIAAVERHRFLGMSQVERLLFTGHASALSAARTARRITQRLATGGLIRSLQRRMGGVASGSTEQIWTVSEAGHRLLELTQHRPAVAAGAIRGDTRRRRFHEPSQRLLDHHLAINEVALVLLELGRNTSNMEDVSLELEPASWRHYDAYGGGRALIRPDLGAVTVTTDDTGEAYEDHWFLEVDLGNEHSPTLLDKCRQYQAYRRSGVEQARLDVFPIVVWVMNSPIMRNVLTDAIAGATDIDDRLFRVVTLGELAAVVRGGAE